MCVLCEACFRLDFQFKIFIHLYIVTNNFVLEFVHILVYKRNPLNYKTSNDIQGLKNPLVRGPGLAILGFEPSFSNPVKTDGPVGLN